VQPVVPPSSESVRDVLARCRTVWRSDILPDLCEGKNVLVIAHGNSIRGMMQAIDGFNETLLADLEVPPCIPLVYRFERHPTAHLVSIQPECAVGVPAALRCEFLAEERELQRAQERTRRVSLQRYGLGPSTDIVVQRGYLPGLETNAASICASIGADFEWDGAVAETTPSDDVEISAAPYFAHDRGGGLPGLEANAAGKWSRLARLAGRERSASTPAAICSAPAIAQRTPMVVIIRHGKTEHNKLGLFTGWEDASLAPEGRKEATEAGQLLAAHGFSFDVVYTSWLSRAIETAWLVLAEIDCLWTPIHKSWRLNERMYGALTGLSKKRTRAQYGEKQFKLWRRSFDTAPPRVDSFSPHYPGNDQRYVQNVLDVRISLKETLVRSLAMGRLCIHRKLPRSESLKDCMERTIPYYVDVIEPAAIKAGKSVLISSSENAIRGLFMHLLSIPPERIAEIEIPNGLPMVYDVVEKRLRLLEGDPSQHNFGKGAELLFGRMRPDGSAHF